MEIQFINHKEWGIETKGFNKYIEKLKKYVKITDGILNIVFVNDPYIQSLNRQYRDKNETTDVLSFSYLNTTDFPDTRLIGEIYISIDTAEKQAKDYGHDLQSELYKLFVHGFLHIFGYDHKKKEDYRVMEGLESEILGE